MVERCGDRQRKFDGLEKWKFRLFIECLPVMLQIALLLLAAGLSRYMWSVNTSVARVVIFFTALGILFYIGILVAGTSSYECPFQTPASIVLRHLRDSGTARKLLARLSPFNTISLMYTTRRITRRLVARLSLPTAVSLMYATWMDAWKGLISASHSVHETIRHPSSLEISLSRITSGIRSACRTVGHKTIILLLRIDRAFRNAKQRLVQETRRFRFRRAVLLPLTTEDANHQPRVRRNGPGLRLRVWNSDDLRKQNGDNARCVCWVLRKITDPEAVDSDVRLAGTIRWFDGDSNHDPPYDSIVSTFEACFDSTKQLYPGMRDRAYFSARAILQINMRARARSHECASKYPIPAIFSGSFQTTDPDLRHVLRMLERNSHTPTLDFPSEDTSTHAHTLWMSIFFVDLTHAGPNPTLESYGSYLKAAVADHRPMIANILLMWYMFLGGHVEEETLWAFDKLYVVILSSSPSARLISCMPVILCKPSSLTCRQE